MQVNLNMSMSMFMFLNSQPPTQPPWILNYTIKQSKEHLIQGTNLYEIPFIPLEILKTR